MAYSYGSQINKNYISSTAFLDQREILNKILDVTNEESSFLDVMELTGRSNPTSVPTYHHFVNQELYVLGTVLSVTGSSTVTATIVLDTDNSNLAFLQANAGDLVLFSNGKVGYLFSKNASTNAIVVKSVDNTNLTVTAADKLSFFSNAAGEGSLSPDARKWQVTKYQNQVQTFKAKFQITDIQKASKVEVEFQGKPFYMYKGQHDSLLKFRGDISAALLFGKISAIAAFDNTYNNYAGNNSGFPAGTGAQLIDGESNPVSTTMGLDQYASLYGYTTTYGAAQSADGVITTDKLMTITKALNKLRAPQEYFLFSGSTGTIAFDNYLNAMAGTSTVGTNSTISTQTRFNISGKEIDLGIDTFKIYGRTYHRKYLPILDHQNIVNYTSTHGLSDAIYGVPATKQKTVDGQMLDRIQVRYMAGDGLDLKYREILLGGLAPVPTNERSVLEIHYQSTQGLQVLGANHLFKIKDYAGV
jgi:hypothetical protein